MSKIAYVNGKYLPQQEAVVNIEDRGYQFGDGIYEVVHVHGGRLIDEDLHLDRMDRSMQEVRMVRPIARTALRHVLREVAHRNRVTEGLLYIQVTRGVAPREHAFPRRPVPAALVVTVRRIPAYPDDIESWTLTAITHPDERWGRCDIKSVNLLPNVLAREAARQLGAGEAILVDGEGMVTEGAATSVWIVDGHGVLRVRALGPEVLPGCTRAALFNLMAANGIVVRQEAFSVAELADAQEAFLTSATSFVKPIVAVDGRRVADGKVGPVTRRLFELFSRHVRGDLHNRR